jgi:hypothetical protein
VTVEGPEEKESLQAFPWEGGSLFESLSSKGGGEFLGRGKFFMKEKVGFLVYHELGSGLGCDRLSLGTTIHNFAESLQAHSCIGQT